MAAVKGREDGTHFPTGTSIQLSATSVRAEDTPPFILKLLKTARRVRCRG